jgi:hypothetical protein
MKHGNLFHLTRRSSYAPRPIPFVKKNLRVLKTHGSRVGVRGQAIRGDVEDRMKVEVKADGEGERRVRGGDRDLQPLSAREKWL